MRKKTALYTPYLDVLGGGEKFVLSILQILSKHDFEPHIFWDKDISRDIESKLNIHIEGLKFIPNIFNKKVRPYERFTSLAPYDLFLYVTDGSYFFSNAKKNIIYAMVPDPALFKPSLLNKIKQANFKFITHSQFVAQLLSKYGIRSTVIYPYLDLEFINFDINLKKEKIILSVGRFFKHLHSKRQDISIQIFQELKKNKQFKDFKLVLAGGVKEKEEKKYMESLKKLAGDDTSIIFEPNINFKDLMKLYGKSMFYWHMTGFGVDEEQHPEQVEHLGITPLEAMATGCIPFCYDAGGPREIISDGENGFLFKTETELMDKMKVVETDDDTAVRIRSTAKSFIANRFNYDIFEKQLKGLIGF